MAPGASWGTTGGGTAGSFSLRVQRSTQGTGHCSAWHLHAPWHRHMSSASSRAPRGAVVVAPAGASALMSSSVLWPCSPSSDALPPRRLPLSAPSKSRTGRARAAPVPQWPAGPGLPSPSPVPLPAAPSQGDYEDVSRSGGRREGAALQMRSWGSRGGSFMYDHVYVSDRL